MDNYMKLELAAIGENESFARGAVAAFALTLNPTLSELSDIKTAVSEAVTNCIVHAYAGGSADKRILVECYTKKGIPHMDKPGARTGDTYGELHIKVTDYGCGIADVERATAPFFTTLEDEERSGMGFTIMLTFMSDFSVESTVGKGTTIYMMKKIGAEEVPEASEVKEQVDA